MKFKAVLNILVLATLITGGNFMNNANLRLFVKSKNFVVFSQNEFLQTDVFNYV